MSRHQQKDAEGGTLMTRKRLYKDASGRIVNKRPARQRRKASKASQDRSISTSYHQQAPLSPPGSNSEQVLSPQDSDKSITDLLFPSLQAEHLDDYNQQFSALDAFNGGSFLWDTALNTVNEAGAPSGPFGDIFMPDTASSFNMPYTTLNNYNWLFDYPIDSGNEAGGSERYSVTDATTAPQQCTPERGRHRHSTTSWSSTATNPPHGPFVPGQEINQTNDTMKDSLCSQAARSSFDRAELSLKSVHPKVESPLCFLDTQVDLPQLDSFTYERLLDIVEHSKAILPSGALVAVDHPLLTQQSLQQFLDLFFTRFNTSYPLIHLATFDPSEVEPLLLITIVLLGATYGDKDSHQLAVCIHDIIRPQIFSHSAFSAKPDLWILQAILLTECLGKSRAGQRQHDMSHLFHGLLINLIRRSDCQIVDPESLMIGEDDETLWRSWSALEQRKRCVSHDLPRSAIFLTSGKLAQLCFVWDVQHAVLFSQSLCMSAFELRSTLPCDQAVWEAKTAREWRRARSGSDKPDHFLTALKRYLNPQCQPAPLASNCISRVIILHGLMSISWDTTRRDQTSMGIMGNNVTSASWHERMAKAYDAWKQDFDECNAILEQSARQLSNLYDVAREAKQDGVARFILAYNAIYHAAHIVLLAEILDLQIFAGHGISWVEESHGSITAAPKKS